MWSIRYKLLKIYNVLYRFCSLKTIKVYLQVHIFTTLHSIVLSSGDGRKKGGKAFPLQFCPPSLICDYTHSYPGLLEDRHFWVTNFCWIGIYHLQCTTNKQVLLFITFPPSNLPTFIVCFYIYLLHFVR